MDAVEAVAVAGAQGQLPRVAVLLGAADSLRAGIDSLATPVDRADFEPVLTAARVQLGEARFKAAWAKGQAMTLEQAIVYALEETG